MLDTPKTTPAVDLGDASSSNDSLPVGQQDRELRIPAGRCPTTSKDSVSRAWDYLLEPVRPCPFVELELAILTFCTGIQDAVTFPDYHCFASNQTGNTVFLMLAILLPELNGDIFITQNIGAGLGFFLLGGWLTGQLSHIVGARRRLWLAGTNLVQSGLVFAAAGIQYQYGVDKDAMSAVAAVGLLAFASGSQVVQSRSLATPEISTAMATAAWVDLMIDKNMFKRENRSRNRRVCFLVALALGALVGAAIYRTAGSFAALVVSAAGKTAVSIMYLFNGKEKPQWDEFQGGVKEAKGEQAV